MVTAFAGLSATMYAVQLSPGDLNIAYHSFQLSLFQHSRCPKILNAII